MAESAIPSDTEGQGAHLRADARMLGMLARRRAWCESLTDDIRARVIRQLEAALVVADSPRDIAAIAKALASLERNDFEAGRLAVDLERSARDDGDSLSAAQLLADVAEIDRRNGVPSAPS